MGILLHDTTIDTGRDFDQAREHIHDGKLQDCWCNFEPNAERMTPDDFSRLETTASLTKLVGELRRELAAADERIAGFEKLVGSFATAIDAMEADFIFAVGQGPKEFLEELIVQRKIAA